MKVRDVQVADTQDGEVEVDMVEFY